MIKLVTSSAFFQIYLNSTRDDIINDSKIDALKFIWWNDSTLFKFEYNERKQTDSTDAWFEVEIRF